MSCVICMNDAKDGCTTLTCGHTFHTACIHQWLNRPGRTCPTCRTGVVPGTQAAQPAQPEGNRFIEMSDDEDLPMELPVLRRQNAVNSVDIEICVSASGMRYIPM